MNKKAFSMIELIFVIVILGILASVAVPKMMGTREDAYIAKGKNQIVSIKNGINMKASEKLLSGGCGGNGRYPDDLNASDYVATPYDGSSGKQLFGGVLQEPIVSSTSDGGWIQTALRTYQYQISSGRTVLFTYYNVASGSINAGTFYCNPSLSDCALLTK